ncbi:hypothetical protein A0257_01750 [Hymenobacter psoromatis]|nr:hypothetical protein A0257_01750 [Hymenobacter psoromatis]
MNSRLSLPPRWLVVLLLLAGLTLPRLGQAQNPLLPGYFADPSIKKFGDKYYLYVTTDGYQPFGNLGLTFVWTSTNLSDWQPEVVEGLPYKSVWAPAVVRGKNNKYYLYCQSSVDYTGYVYVGDTPTGPFKKANQLGGFDLEPFTDPVSGKIYVVSASQEIYEMDNDPASPTYLTRITNRIPVKGRFDFTEAPYLFYRKGLYYLMWAGGSCSQKNYNVRYATAKSLAGPYVDAPAPLLQTDEAHGVFGPGHNSMLEVEGRTFVLYHRQDAERAPTCGFRFTCASEVTFNPDGSLKFLRYIDDLGAALGRKSPYQNLALNKPVSAKTEETAHRVIQAVDGRNDTRWTTGANEPGTLTIDLLREQAVQRVEMDFEYPDKLLTFKLEYSTDNLSWTTLADHSKEAIMAYQARALDQDFRARYVRLTVLNSEDRNASVWELRVLGPNAGH